ncbi:DUF4249 domain-containing protein [Fulvivirgaceae bacterium BMA10]|uniref:DUF4249 domain-containing protein n=1 Tax=Splendidivirga corallicola TaxID=3051826 RepID=A0ABT8KL45_9BACT|nr:DUF4249 domain-containing protein [Fulvivirgaceae bacterium BMA10]
MEKKAFILAHFFFICLLCGCVEPFDSEIPGGSNFLTIDALITDEPGPYLVELSRSGSLSGDGFEPVSNAVVSIEEENGITEQLTEESEGKYFTSKTGIIGKAGKRYRLRVSLSDGEVYESSWSLLKRAPPIDRVYWNYEQKEDNDGNILEGAQLFVDAHDPENNTKFYKYEWIETWTYIVPFATALEFLENFDIVPREKNQICWIDTLSSAINIVSSLKNSEDVVIEHPLNFVSTETGRLRLRYSILVKQLALSEEEYFFWKSLKETNNELGNLFDKQPQSIQSNIRNISNPDQRVLGYFSASGVSTKRIFIDNKDLPERVIVKSFVDDCELIEIPFTQPFDIAQKEVLSKIRNGYLFYDFAGLLSPTGFYVTKDICADCTIKGGRVVKPEFWID